MTSNPILKVLSTFKRYKVKSLLIGGQACIIYGGAEFSRDSDFIILCDDKNLARLKKALANLRAGLIYLPKLESEYLKKGHACHFRCAAKGLEGLRIDVISKLRGCDPFDVLWKRKKAVSAGKAGAINIVSLKDLVQSKKTQRDKDWLMLRRLVENDAILNWNRPANDRVKWWFLEGRIPERLIDLAKRYPAIAKKCIKARPLLAYAAESDLVSLEAGLHNEELMERRKDIEYWTPLKKELEALRHRTAAKRS